MDVELIVALITIVGAVAAALKWGKNAVRWLWRWLERLRPRDAFRTVFFPTQCTWQMHHKKDTGEPVLMALQARCKITNVSKEDAFLVRVYIKKPFTEGTMFLTDVVTGQILRGHWEFPPNLPIDATVSLTVEPPVARLGEPFRTRIIFVDSHDIEYRTRKLTFASIK